MKFKDIFVTDIEPGYQSEFRISALSDNVKRIRVFSALVIVMEVLLAASDLVNSLLKTDERFHFNSYLAAYLIMILANVSLLVFVRKTGKIEGKSPKSIRFIENVILIYITFFMCWGSVVSLMDQKLYGQLVVFMINMIVCSILYFIEFRKLLFAYLLSTAILVIGLPFVQHSSDVLIGHYINLTVFILISLISSRIVFYNYCHDFNNKILISKMHRELQELSYLDELTCLPNRRSFNHFIDTNYRGKRHSVSSVSVIMIDIDFFKQFNDQYGHMEGDKVLVRVAEQIKGSVVDGRHFAARIGGEEFIYLTQGEDPSSVVKIAESLRSRIELLKIPNEKSGHRVLTISLGVSRIELTLENTIDKSIEFADKALYKAKISGRNCIRFYDGVLFQEI